MFNRYVAIVSFYDSGLYIPDPLFVSLLFSTVDTLSPYLLTHSLIIFPYVRSFEIPI